MIGSTQTSEKWIESAISEPYLGTIQDHIIPRWKKLSEKYACWVFLDRFWCETEPKMVSKWIWVTQLKKKWIETVILELYRRDISDPFKNWLCTIILPQLMPSIHIWSIFDIQHILTTILKWNNTKKLKKYR